MKGHEGVLGLDSDITDGENNYCYCEQDDSDQVKEKTVQYSEPSDVEINHKQEEGVCKQVEETTVQELHVNGFSGEKLRFLVHNTTPDGVRFFLSFLMRRESIKTFSKSKICRVMFGKMLVSTLKEIYLHRKYLTSFCRLGRNYPYPDKGMIHRCIACGATERGKCVCPILPKYFLCIFPTGMP